jgi:phosphosulfolactate phosphohydrolase-like enzyme
VRIEGFDFGNSPAEIAAAEPADTLVLTTTNGTRLLLAAAARCERVLVGSLLNLSAVAAAEAIGGEHHDSAAAAIRLAQSFDSSFEGLSASQSARNLRRSGLQADIVDCARESVLEVVPRYSRMVGSAAEVVAASEPL